MTVTDPQFSPDLYREFLPPWASQDYREAFLHFLGMAYAKGRADERERLINMAAAEAAKRTP